MKYTSFFQLIIFLASSCASLALYSQNNTIKGRALYVPEIDVFTVSIGYERRVSARESVQILYSHYGYNNKDSDGNLKIVNAITPEYRVYFGRHLGENFNKCAFLGAFTEFTFSRLETSGFDLDPSKKSLAEEKEVILSPGVLIGKNLQISEKCFFDVYVGGKYRFINTESRFFENQNATIEESTSNKVGIRVGANFGYRF